MYSVLNANIFTFISPYYVMFWPQTAINGQGQEWWSYAFTPHMSSWHSA
jgi:hypothetical protein